VFFFRLSSSFKHLGGKSDGNSVARDHDPNSVILLLLSMLRRRRLEHFICWGNDISSIFLELFNAFISDSFSFGRTRNRGMRKFLAFGPVLNRSYFWIAAVVVGFYVISWTVCYPQAGVFRKKTKEELFDLFQWPLKNSSLVSFGLRKTQLI